MVFASARGMDALVDVLNRFESDSLTLDALKRAQSALSEARSEHFSRGPRLSLCRRVRQFFSLEDLEVFFGLVSSPRDRVAFLLMLAFGLRVSEVSRCVFHEESMQLRVYSEKLDRFETLPVYPGALVVARASRDLVVSSDGLRNRFRLYRSRDPRLCYSYCSSLDDRRLYQYSSKSLRKTAVQFVYAQCRDPLVTSLFSRHSLPARYGQVSAYLYFDDEELRAVMQEALGSIVSRLSSSLV